MFVQSLTYLSVWFSPDSMVLKVGSGEIDDLSTLNVLDEESLLRELRARYKKGIIYVNLVPLDWRISLSASCLSFA